MSIQWNWNRKYKWNTRALWLFQCFYIWLLLHLLLLFYLAEATRIENRIGIHVNFSLSSPPLTPLAPKYVTNKYIYDIPKC